MYSMPASLVCKHTNWTTVRWGPCASVDTGEMSYRSLADLSCHSSQSFLQEQRVQNPHLFMQW